MVVFYVWMVLGWFLGEWIVVLYVCPLSVSLDGLGWSWMVACMVVWLFVWSLVWLHLFMMSYIVIWRVICMVSCMVACMVACRVACMVCVSSQSPCMVGLVTVLLMITWSGGVALWTFHAFLPPSLLLFHGRLLLWDLCSLFLLGYFLVCCVFRSGVDMCVNCYLWFI